MSNDKQMVTVQGRIVWVHGDLFQGAPDTIFGTTNPKINAKTGKQDTVYRFGLAVFKTDLADPARGGALWSAMHNQVRALYPSGQIPPSFAWKYKDGDSQGVDERGGVVDYSKKEGYPGCLVFTLSTTNYPPRFFKWENGNVQIGEGIKCGDYVNVQVEVAGQVSAKPGLYLNPKAVQLVAPGQEIINAPSADQVFGTSAPAMPSNYVAPQVGAMPSMPAPSAPGQYPAPVAAQPMAPQPNYQVVPPQFQPPAGGVPMNPPMPPPMGNGYPAPAAAPMNPQSWAPNPGMSAPTASGPVSPAYPSSGMPPVPR